MLSIPSRALNNKFLNSIEGYKGNLHKIGRLLSHDWWNYFDKNNKQHDRYLFLFKSRILVCKVRKINDDRSVFILTNIIKLPNSTIEFNANDNSLLITEKSVAETHKFKPKKESLGAIWYQDILSHVNLELSLSEHKADDLRVDFSNIVETNEPTLRLPPIILADNSIVNINPSDVAQNYFLPKIEKEKLKEHNAKTLELKSNSVKELKSKEILTSQNQAQPHTDKTQNELLITKQTEFQPDENFQSSEKIDGKISTSREFIQIHETSENLNKHQNLINQNETQLKKPDADEIPKKLLETIHTESEKSSLCSEDILEKNYFPGDFNHNHKDFEILPKQPATADLNGEETPLQNPNLSLEDTKQPPSCHIKVVNTNDELQTVKSHDREIVSSDSVSTLEVICLNKTEVNKEENKIIKDNKADLEGEETVLQNPNLSLEVTKQPSSYHKQLENTSEELQIFGTSDRKIVSTDSDLLLGDICLNKTIISKETIVNKEERKIKSFSNKEIENTSYLEEIEVNNNTSGKKKEQISDRSRSSSINLSTDKPTSSYNYIKQNNNQDSNNMSHASAKNINTSASNNITNIRDSESLAQFNNAIASVASGDCGGQGLLISSPPSQMPPHSIRMPGFFQPLPRISYETTLEILIVKTRPPPPPPPPPTIKRVVVDTERLEQKTKNFLDGTYDQSSLYDTSLRNAKQKIRSIKSTVIKSSDTTRYAEDTVQKAKARDFIHIFTPPIRKKRPAYEIVEVPYEYDELAESIAGDLREGTADIDSRAQSTDRMDDYYASSYQTRSSRKTTERKYIKI